MHRGHLYSPDLFHPLIDRWFKHQIGTPTTVQREGWARIAAGEHVLLTAPTGSGKTFAAFLWAIDQLVRQIWSGGTPRVLYISPLKALNNDIHRNLTTPLTELRALFEREEEVFPPISVQTRSGDTAQSDRRRMLRHPPEILITTPESLNLLLSSAGGRTLLGGIKTVILDEIHAVVSNKRGVHLISAVDRLVRLSGDFQRIALSATVKPMSAVAEFVGGYRLSGSSTAARYTPRPVAMIQSDAAKRYRVQVRHPHSAGDRPAGESFWQHMAERLKETIHGNRSTLLFTNSRRLCEKLTLKINQGENHTAAYAHHGSLSREIREVVESRLKSGDLKAIVATNSLELGIDIGDLDEVVLVQSPPSVSAAVQRVGRAGHRLGETSRGTLYPTHSRDFLEAAVLAAAIPAGDIEEISPVQCPLDVLAQIVVSMVGVETWDRDDLFAWLKTSHPYRSMSRDHYDLVLDMLSGRYADSRVRELKPRISIDGLDNTVAARPGALLNLYTSGGVIPDRGYYHLRHNETNARIGELDEEFVWEATIGQTFTLGTQSWKITRITHNDVMVVQAGPKAVSAPFWKGEERRRDYHFSNRLAEFLEDADGRLGSPEYLQTLESRHFMDADAAAELVGFLKRQKAHTGEQLPHRRHLLVEYIGSGPASVPGHQVVLHTLWGGRLNHPYALALTAAWKEKYGQKLEVYADNDGISLMLPHQERPQDLLNLVTAAGLSQLLRKQLEGSGIFGARFRECAGRALLLTRRKVNERMPLWMNRLRSQKLLEAVSGFNDFPILMEAWRTCLQDEFDLKHLHQMLTELEDGRIGWSAARTATPSPMAQSMAWRQINQYMYMSDEPASGRTSSLDDDVLNTLIHSPQLRPTVSQEVVAAFESKRKRLAPGYAPGSARDILDWVKERHLISLDEWHILLDAIQRDHGMTPEEILLPLSEKIFQITAAEAQAPLIGALETLPKIIEALYGPSAAMEIRSVWPHEGASTDTVRQDMMMLDRPSSDQDEALTSIVNEWMQFHGPMTMPAVGHILGVPTPRLGLAVDRLVDDKKWIAGCLVTDKADHHLCDTENFETLLRLSRAAASPKIDPLPIDHLQLFLATFQGIARPQAGVESMFRVLDALLCCPVKAGMWETEILPARLKPYRKEWLDQTLQETDLLWVGGPGQTVAFCFETDLDLLWDEGPSPEPSGRSAEEAPGDSPIPGSDLFPDPFGRYNFKTLQQITGRSAASLFDALWDGVWHGRITNDTLLALRQGIETGFKPPRDAADYLPSRSRRRRTGYRSGNAGAFHQWKKSRNLPGNWFHVQKPEPAGDPIEMEERNKARVRLLLDRYGILFRELLLREEAAFRWNALFRSLRMMELAGEIVTGYFFQGIPGLQFISPKTLGMLRGKWSRDEVFWLNAADPGSLCGVRLDGLRGTLPRRLPSTHLVYHGTEWVMVSRRRGKDLAFHVPPDHADLPRYMGPLQHLLMRAFRPRVNITVDTINGEPAALSPYLGTIGKTFDVVPDYRSITLYLRREAPSA